MSHINNFYWAFPPVDEVVENSVTKSVCVFTQYEKRSESGFRYM